MTINKCASSLNEAVDMFLKWLNVFMYNVVAETSHLTLTPLNKNVGTGLSH